MVYSLLCAQEFVLVVLGGPYGKPVVRRGSASRKAGALPSGDRPLPVSL